MFELIYRNRIIAHVDWVPIVGDEYEDYIVWEVDYRHKYAYLTEAR